jgi:methylenetetrahydrofolate dehydrogenase (NADP+) / methenyltetrahydrofolate cyclohydrolase
MTISGRQLADELLVAVRERVLALPTPPQLAIVTGAPSFATQKYLHIKERMAARVGVSVDIHEVAPAATTDAYISAVQAAAATAAGVIVQLPLPAQVDREAVLAAIPIAGDADGFWYGARSDALPTPVVQAVDYIARRYHVIFKDALLAVIGEGRLVGRPLAHFAREQGARVTVVNETTSDHDRATILKQAAIIISGVGKPGIIGFDDVQDGVAVFDAGTSEDGGVLTGDIDARVAEKAALFTPVPGGIGPLTIATLLGNVVTLAERHQRDAAGPFVV